MFTSNFERLDCNNYAFYISNDICKVYKRKTNKNSSRFPAIKTKYFTIQQNCNPEQEDKCEEEEEEEEERRVRFKHSLSLRDTAKPRSNLSAVYGNADLPTCNAGHVDSPGT